MNEPGGLNDYIAYRQKRAKEAYEEALILYENQKWNAVINRLYYACFYSVIGQLIKNEIETTTHEGVRTMLGLHFVKTGKISKNSGKLFSKLFDLRNKGDYGDMFDFDKETVTPLLDQVKLFLEEIDSVE